MQSYNIGTDDAFVCTTGETVSLNALCDGTADCSNGNDERSPICESMWYGMNNEL